MANKIEEPLVSTPVALLAKAKGFNVPVGQFYGNYTDDCDTLKLIKEDFQLLQRRRHGIYAIIIEDYNNQYTYGDVRINQEDCSAPTQSLLQKWMRDVHNIDIEIRKISAGYQGFASTSVEMAMQQKWDAINTPKAVFLRYEAALEDALLFGLTLIPDNQK